MAASLDIILPWSYELYFIAIYLQIENNLQKTYESVCELDKTMCHYNLSIEKCFPVDHKQNISPSCQIN